MLEISSLDFAYQGEESLFSSFSLSMEENERILILSPPGSGKTTLAKILTGAIDEKDGSLSSFSFSIDGVSVRTLDNKSSFVSRVAQDSSELIIFPTVRDEVAFPLAVKGMNYGDLVKRRDEILSMYDLGELSESGTMELSGGERRRLSLAVNDAIDSTLTIYDESFDELSEKYASLLKRQIENKKYVIVLSSRYLSLYEGFFSKVYTISEGNLVVLDRISSRAFPSISPSQVEKKHTLVANNIRFTLSHEGSSIHSSINISADGFSLSSGEIKLLVGDNGSGKSTLSRILVGLYRENEGAVMLDGVALSDKERRTKISYLMQDPYPSLYLATVSDELHSVTKDEGKIEEALAIFSLDRNEYVSSLSYGKAKLLQFAIYYILSRPFAIFDEPDVALSYEEIARTLDAYTKEGIGILLITHDENIKDLDFPRYHMKAGVLL